AQWVSSSKACWRIFGFSMSDMNPLVICLSCHLSNHHIVNFFEYINITEILSDENSKKTMLTEYFHLNITDPEAQSAQQRGLLEADKSLHECMSEAKQFHSSYALNFIKNGIPEGQLCINAVLEHINHFLQQHDKNIDNYDLPKITNLVNEELPRLILEELSIP
ncbi:16259_t:CDS:2, partial [Cetraspora pellucida]